jgi:hypothetical protein
MIRVHLEGLDSEGKDIDLVEAKICRKFVMECLDSDQPPSLIITSKTGKKPLIIIITKA